MAISQKSFERRIGRFRIDRHLIDNRPEDVLRLLRDILIVRAELSYEYDAIEYVGISEQFASVPEGCITPEYFIEEQVETEEVHTMDAPTPKIVVTNRTRRFVPVDPSLRGRMPSADAPHMEVAEVW